VHNLNIIINIIDIIVEQPSPGVPLTCPLPSPSVPWIVRCQVHVLLDFGRLPSPHVPWTWLLPSLGVPWTWLIVKFWSHEGDPPAKSTCSLTVKSMCPLDLPDSKVQVPWTRLPAKSSYLGLDHRHVQE